MKTNLHSPFSILATSLAALVALSALHFQPACAQLADDFNPGAEGSPPCVYSLAVQADGKILMGGYFSALGGQPRSCIARLNADGTPDSAFNSGANGLVNSLAVQADGKILVGGEFTTLGGQTCNYLGRLNADGTPDSGFNAGADNSVYSLAVQADGKMLVGGGFATLGGQPRSCIARLNADGTLDSVFNPGANGPVNSLAVQVDGRILVGGWFSTLGGQTRNNIGRLNANGTLDSAFNAGADGQVYSLAVQTDEKILVGGSFTNLCGQPRNNIGRLNADGTLDSAFNPGANYHVRSLALQADGKILVGGSSDTSGPQTGNYLGRLNADGTVDSGFTAGAYNGWVYSLALQADGKILAGGDFYSLGGPGQPRECLGRLNNTEPATQSLSYDGSTITWLRGGASPEVWRTTFDFSTNGADWASLGAGARMAGRWSLNRLSLPSTHGTIRARGYVIGGQNEASGWFVETDYGMPVFLSQPGSLTNAAGTTATFSVVAGGSAPLSCRWLKDGVPLADGGNIAGGGTAVLTLTGVLRADTGGYSVVVSNGFGSVTSVVASLAVIDPVIAVQPASQDLESGQSVTLTVTAAGTPPLGYQWWKEGVPMAGDAKASLTLTNLQAGDAGQYLVVVSNQFGSVTSTVALLTVNEVTLDSAFNPGASNSVSSLAVQADGKILVGGLLATLGGQTRNNIGRVNADGTLDSAFNPGADNLVSSLAVQADGKILAGGWFANLCGQPRTFLGRLNADGSLDSAFHLGPTSGVNGPFGPGPINGVYGLALQADGKILVGGSFTNLAGQPRNCLGRLNADGTLDRAFNQGPALVYGHEERMLYLATVVYCLAVQADGKILLGGNFASLGGQTRNNIGRLNSDGTLDSAFNPGADSLVYSLAVQADGKILAGGYFTTLGGQTRNGIGRLNADGTLDAGFNPGANGWVGPLALQADGKILVGGYFTTLGGQTRNNIGRLNADGTLDSAFNPGASGSVNSLALEAEGKILVGGWFTNLAGQTRNYIGRLNNTEPATQSLGLDGSTITWLRGGTSPEVWRTTFDFSTNGTDWAGIGAGVRVAGGWQLASVSLPSATGAIRARGYVTGGADNASSWFVETMAGPPAISFQPNSVTLNAGTTASFSVGAGSSAPLSYQ